MRRAGWNMFSGDGADAKARAGRTTPARSILRQPAALAIGLTVALCLLFVLPAGLAAAASPDTWTPQASGTTQVLNGVAFTSRNVGWAVGAGGTIRHTTNGGTTWTKQTSGTSQTLYGVFFSDAANGWAVGAGGAVRHTADGGSSWTGQTSGVTQTLYAVYFTDAANGWAVGAGGTIRHTTDGGDTWAAQTSNSRQALYGVAFTDAKSGWAVGGRGTLLRTQNGGAAWAAQSASTKQTLHGVVFADGVNGWIVGGKGSVRHTGNSGSSWASQSAGTHATFYAVAFADTVHGWAVGAGGAIWRTSDGGSSWSAQRSGTTQTLRAVTHASSDLWTVGSGGTIIACVADVTPPTTTATGLQADDHSGWRNAGQTVIFAASDARSGVAAIHFTLDGGAPQTYGAAFAVAGAGQHAVTYWAVDKAGNVEPARTGWVNIDLLSPTVSADADGAWHAGAVIVHLSSADTGGSGVAAAQYRLNGGTDWSPATGEAFTVEAPANGSNDGVHDYEFRSLDNAGNASGVGACTVKIDASPATTLATGLAADQLTGWTSGGPRTVDLAADDGSGSGVAAIYYTVDGGGQQLYAGSFTVSGAGQHAVVYWSVDAIGNVEPARTGWVNIGNPFAETSGLAGDDHSGWRNTAATVTITGGGDNAPFSVSYQVDGGAWQTVPSPASFSVGGVGHHTVVYYVENAVPVRTAQLTGYVNIETTAPITKALAVPAGWRRTAVTVQLSPADAGGSGVAATYYRIDGGVKQTGTSAVVPAPLDHTMDGIHKVTYYSVDAAGNVESPKQFTVRIDTRRPTTKAPLAAVVTRYHWVKLRCLVSDPRPSATRAAMKIRIKDRRGRVVLRLNFPHARTRLWLSPGFTCRLPRGAYRFSVYATDAAGNVQSKIGSNRLTVR